MQRHLPVLIALLLVFIGGRLLAPRVKLPLPVVLALAGIALAFVPGLSLSGLDPDLVLVFFLPPLLYADAFDTSWVDFRRWMRPILMLAVGLVAVTILTVGLVTHALLPELPWAVGFILGAIVSPTDTIAVQAVLARLRIPRRATAILGGESLVNDATGLVGVQIGVAVVLSGAFEAGRMLASFAWVAGGGIAIGVAIGYLIVWANRRIRTSENLFALSLLAPWLTFAVAQHVGTSGVVAVVVSGFVVAWNIHVVEPDARVDLYTTWSAFTPVLNGVCFVFIGLETPRIVAEAAIGSSGLLTVGLVISAVVILTRIVWVLPSAYLPLWLSPRLRAREGGYPRFPVVALASWCGVRGIVSLAAALALPITLADGSPFPGRREIVACTLFVILVTLLLQGSTLQLLISALGIRSEEGTEDEQKLARETLVRASIARLDLYCSERSCPVAVHRWRELLVDELGELIEEDAEQRALAKARLSVSRDVRRAVAEAQSAELLRLRNSGAIDDRTYLEIQLEIDRERRAVDGRAARPA